MSNLGLPNIMVTFNERAQSAVRNLNAQTVAACVIEETPGVYVITKISDIPITLTQASKSYINRIFTGSYGKSPAKVIISANETLDSALSAISAYNIDWVCANNTTEDTDDTFYEDVATWVELQRTNGMYCKAVVANHAANSEYVVNFTTESIMTDDGEVTAAAFTGRIAGILASLPYSQSCTFFVLPDVNSVQDITSTNADTAIAAGKLILINDGEAVRIARGVNSATGDSVEKKIKLVAAKDKVEREIKTSVKDSYVGKYACTYDNKCLLICALSNYFKQLAKSGVVAAQAQVRIDTDAQEAYLAQAGVDVSAMTAQEIKEANTGDEVFVSISVTLLDSMENFTISVSNE